MCHATFSPLNCYSFVAGLINTKPFGDSSGRLRSSNTGLFQAHGQSESGQLCWIQRQRSMYVSRIFSTVKSWFSKVVYSLNFWHCCINPTFLYLVFMFYMLNFTAFLQGRYRTRFSRNYKIRVYFHWQIFIFLSELVTAVIYLRF